MGGVVGIVVGGENTEVIKVIDGACSSVGVLELAEHVKCHDFLKSELWDDQDEITIRNAQNAHCNYPLGTAGFGFNPVTVPVRRPGSQ